jgi:hypothetical protein
MNAPEKRHPGQWSGAAPGEARRLRSLAIGGALLVVVLGGYWYFNSAGDDTRTKP